MRTSIFRWLSLTSLSMILNFTKPELNSSVTTLPMAFLHIRGTLIDQELRNWRGSEPRTFSENHSARKQPLHTDSRSFAQIRGRCFCFAKMNHYEKSCDSSQEIRPSD